SATGEIAARFPPRLRTAVWSNLRVSSATVDRLHQFPDGFGVKTETAALHAPDGRPAQACIVPDFAVCFPPVPRYLDEFLWVNNHVRLFHFLVAHLFRFC